MFSVYLMIGFTAGVVVGKLVRLFLNKQTKSVDSAKRSQGAGGPGEPM